MNKYLLFLFLLAAYPPISAQQLLSSAGEVQTNGGYALSWSLGEPATASYSEGGSLLTQGFQQVSDLTTSLSARPTLLSLALHPNPCQDRLYLSFAAPGEYQITMLDASGRTLLEQVDHFGQDNVLDVSGLPAGAYTLWIRQSEASSVFSTTILKSN